MGANAVGAEIIAALSSGSGLLVAFLLGGAIGLERQIRQRTAGLRTNVLVAVGAAAFVDLGARVGGADGSARVIAYVVSGIGFLGAGVIMKEGMQVRGLNTAATLWGTAAVGACAGAGQRIEALFVALLVLAGNTLLRPLADFVNRQPISPEQTEALYRVHVTCLPARIADARDLLAEECERQNYPLRDIETVSETPQRIELEATLIPSSAVPAKLDQIVARLEHSPSIETATWSVSATA
jgi:putative Mg2+ transporter-C (MgtC) family protein